MLYATGSVAWRVKAQEKALPLIVLFAPKIPWHPSHPGVTLNVIQYVSNWSRVGFTCVGALCCQGHYSDEADCCSMAFQCLAFLYALCGQVQKRHWNLAYARLCLVNTILPTGTVVPCVSRAVIRQCASMVCALVNAPADRAWIVPSSTDQLIEPGSSPESFDSTWIDLQSIRGRPPADRFPVDRPPVDQGPTSSRPPVGLTD